MQLQITKFSGKKNVVKYIRDNGTETWMYSDDFFVLHDLSHYALEKVLGYATAFCGMLNSGISIQDFEDMDKRKAILITKEAVYAENMANLFLMETAQGGFADMNTVIKQAHETVDTKYPAPVLTAVEINTIRTYLSTLVAQWKALGVGHTLQLNFIL